MACFDSRLGTSTGVDVSGTAEEINKAADAGEPVHVYFSDEPLPRDVDPNRLSNVAGPQEWSWADLTLDPRSYNRIMSELGVAVAAVIVAGLTGLGGIGTAVWTTRRNEKMTRESMSISERLTRDTLAANERLTRETLSANERLTRENRLEDKRADAYLEPFRLIELEGLALETTMNRLDARTEPDYGQARPRTTERPPLSDRASINALLAAFGSPKLTLLVEGWIEGVQQFDEEHERVAFNWQENVSDPNEPIESTTLDGLRALLRVEQGEREAVAEQVVSELASLEAR